MTPVHNSRHIDCPCIHNLRDLGGYRAKDGRSVAWRQLYRGGEPLHATREDVDRLIEATGLASVLDLRSEVEISRESVELLTGAGIRYHNVSLMTGGNRNPDPDGDIFNRYTNMGQFYVFLLHDAQFRERLVEALEIVAAAENRPLLFHCTVGKDRTGVLAAFVLSLLGVRDEDIIADYAMTAPSMAAFLDRLKDDPEMAYMVEALPGYFWEAAPESMALLLTNIRKEYGSARDYVASCCNGDSLPQRLADALLEG